MDLLVQFEQYSGVKLSENITAVGKVKKERPFFFIEIDLSLSGLSASGESLFQKAYGRIYILVLPWIHKVNQRFQMNQPY